MSLMRYYGTVFSLYSSTVLSYKHPFIALHCKIILAKKGDYVQCQKVGFDYRNHFENVPIIAYIFRQSTFFRNYQIK